MEIALLQEWRTLFFNKQTLITLLQVPLIIRNILLQVIIQHINNVLTMRNNKKEHLRRCKRLLCRLAIHHLPYTWEDRMKGTIHKHDEHVGDGDDAWQDVQQDSNTIHVHANGVNVVLNVGIADEVENLSFTGVWRRTGLENIRMRNRIQERNREPILSV